MPVSPQVGGGLRYDDEVAHPDGNDRFAAWAGVCLAGLIGLDRKYGLWLEDAH